jgi:outer membrane protein OmpA-like peptidoglycan-associated protein
MTTNLIQLIRSQLTPEIIHRASALVGEGPDRTRRAMEAAVPTLVTALADTASSPAGAEQLTRVLGDPILGGGPGSYLDRLAEGDGGGQSVMQAGKELLGRALGNRAGAVVEATASSTATSRSAMHGLLGMVTPLVLGAIGREARARNLDAAGLASLLDEQRRAVVEPGPVITGPRPAPRPPEVRELRDAGARPPPSPGTRSLWPLAVLLPLIILGFLLFRRRDVTAPTAPTTTPESAPVVRELPAEPAPQVDLKLPGGGVVRVPQGSTGYQLARFLATPGEPAPKRFVFDELVFDTATARPSPASEATLAAIAAVLKAYPTAEIVIEGHTDNVGDPAANQVLSRTRAEAVKRTLAGQGVAPTRVSVAGLGQDRPIAPNDTEDGRARNRRTELVVVRR